MLLKCVQCWLSDKILYKTALCCQNKLEMRQTVTKYKYCPFQKEIHKNLKNILITYFMLQLTVKAKLLGKYLILTYSRLDWMYF